MILMFVSLLPFTSISMAASIKLNEIAQEEKIRIIQEVLKEAPEANVGNIENEADVDLAIIKLIQNGFILDAAEVKKGGGGESVGGR